MASRGELVFKSSPANLPAALMAGAFFISTILSRNLAASFKGLHEVSSYLLLFFVCTNLRGEAPRRKIAYTLIAAALIESVFAVVQFARGVSRVSGSVTYPTYLVDTLIIGLSLAAGLALFSKKLDLRRLYILVPVVLLLFVAIFFTRARAGLIALAASLVVLGLLRSKRWLAIAVVIVVAVAVVPNPIRDRILIAGKQDIYAMERPNIWKQALDISMMRPSVGVGMWNYTYYSRMTNFPVQQAVGRYAKAAEMAHNQYLDYLATTGLVGFAAFLLFLGTVLASGIKFVKTRDPVAVGSLAAVIAILAHSFVDNALYLPLNGYAFFALAGILCSESENMRSFKTPGRARMYICVLTVIYGFIVVRPAVSISFYDAGVRRAKAGDIDGAIRPCWLALALSPSEAVYHDALAKLYAKKYDETRSAGYMYITQTRFDSAIRSNPLDKTYWEDFADFMYQHRVEMGEEGAYSDMAKLLKAAVDVDPYNAFLRRKLAGAYYERGSYEKALIELKMLVNLEPNYFFGRYMLGQVYGKLGMKDREEEQYQILRKKKLEHLELKIQNEYEKELLEFDWSLLPKENLKSEQPDSGG
jgi:O-antigen ligase